jgi:biopolymer transport protein ExbB
MNVMLLLAQVAPALTDSIAGANPVLTQVNASDEMNLWSMAIKGGWIMVVLGLMSVLCFYILFERNYVIRKAGKEDPQFMDKIKDYILGGELKAAIAYCRSSLHSYRTRPEHRVLPSLFHQGLPSPFLRSVRRVSSHPQK